MAIYVVNKRFPESFDARDGIYVYIGRPSIWGNPRSDGTREEQIRAYETHWVESMMRDCPLRRAADNLYEVAKHLDVFLVCWCAPKACHGDVIKRWIEGRLKNQKFVERYGAKRPRLGEVAL